MARRREQMRPVVLVDDADDATGTAAAAPPQVPDEHRRRARRVRRRLAAAAALVVVVAGAAWTADASQDARERARYAAVAGQWRAVAPVHAPVEVLWHAEGPGAEERFLSSARTPDGLLVGVTSTSAGGVEVTAVDVRTGEERWRTPLLDAPDLPVPSGLVPVTGVCAAHPGVSLVACLADDSRWDLSGVGDHVAATTARLVLLDPRDGRVVQDLSEPAGAPLPSSLALLDGVVVTAAADGEQVTVTGRTLDGERAWSHLLESAANPYGWTNVTAGGDVVVAYAPEVVAVLGRDGEELARMPGAHTTLSTSATSATSVAVVVPRGEVRGPEDLRDARSTVVHDGRTVELEGMAVETVADDGSAPGLTLTTTADAMLHAWGPDGAELWSAPGPVEQAVVLQGRVHTFAGEGWSRGEGGDGVVTYDARTGEELWRGPGDHRTVTDGSRLYRPDVDVEDGRITRALVAVDPASGREVWRSPLPDCSGEVQPLAGLLTCPTNGETRTSVLG